MKHPDTVGGWPKTRCPITTEPAHCYHVDADGRPCHCWPGHVRNVRHQAIFNRSQGGLTKRAKDDAVPVYIFRAKNNPVRASLFGRRCAITAISPRARKRQLNIDKGQKDFNTCALVFLDDGFEVVTSRNYLRREVPKRKRARTRRQ
jgi:hypothetical protein